MRPGRAAQRKKKIVTKRENPEGSLAAAKSLGELGKYGKGGSNARVLEESRNTKGGGKEMAFPN